MARILAVASATAVVAGGFLDCSPESVRAPGPFGEMAQLTSKDEEGKDVFAFYPQDLGQGPFPVIVFSHGSTGEWIMYKDAFQQYVSHGFVVVFPHIKSPEDDIKSFTTDPMGDFTIKGYNFARSANGDASSPLFGALDTANIVLAGHSMGASSTIMAAHKLDPGSVKLAYAQHPGICGPFGPPPCLGPVCSTWMPNDFKDAASKVPMVLSTATNDGAFWPAPHTAQHELGCFQKSTGEQAQGTAFVEFSEAACQDDGQGGRPGRNWSNGGHDCPMKGNSTETPWVLVASKLYAQFGGQDTSRCHSMLWGGGDDSIHQDTAVAQSVVNPPLARAKGFPDCSAESVRALGPYGDMVQLTAKDEEGKDVFAFHPQDLGQGPFPVIVFSHGGTGEWIMYKDAFQRYVSHGFVVIFPHVKSPEDDIKQFTADPKGGFTIKGYNFARSANKDVASPLFGALDTANIVLAGHSMGGSSTIMAAHKLDPGSVKLAYAQHPLLCGPIGPPPCLGPGPLCSTWMPKNFKDAASKVPMVLSTSTNDAAFWPAPKTAEHELNCFHKSIDGVQTRGTAFVQFSEVVCEDDQQGGRPGRNWSNGGHDCPMKSKSVETPWVLVAAKLYAQFGGQDTSNCHSMLWGDGDDSIASDTAIEQSVVNGPQGRVLLV